MSGAVPSACQGGTPKILAHRHVFREDTPIDTALGALGPEPQNFPAQSGAKNMNTIQVVFRATTKTANLPPQDASPHYSGHVLLEALPN